jgi:hypothetical protein
LLVKVGLARRAIADEFEAGLLLSDRHVDLRSSEGCGGVESGQEGGGFELHDDGTT